MPLQDASAIIFFDIGFNNYDKPALNPKQTILADPGSRALMLAHMQLLKDLASHHQISASKVLL